MGSEWLVYSLSNFQPSKILTEVNRCALFFLKASGIKLDESCKKMFSLVKDKHEHAWAIMKIDNDKEVVLTKQHGKLVSNTDLEENERLFEAMKGNVAELDGPCYILFDFVYRQKSGATKDKPIYIYW